MTLTVFGLQSGLTLLLGALVSLLADIMKVVFVYLRVTSSREGEHAGLTNDVVLKVIVCRKRIGRIGAPSRRVLI